MFQNPVEQFFNPNINEKFNQKSVKMYRYALNSKEGDVNVILTLTDDFEFTIKFLHKCEEKSEKYTFTGTYFREDSDNHYILQSNYHNLQFEFFKLGVQKLDESDFEYKLFKDKNSFLNNIYNEYDSLLTCNEDYFIENNLLNIYDKIKFLRMMSL